MTPEVVVRIGQRCMAVLQITLQGIPQFWKMPFYMSAINYICKAAKILQDHFPSRRFTAVERQVWLIKRIATATFYRGVSVLSPAIVPSGSRSLLAGTLEQNEDIAAVITCNHITPTIPNKKCHSLEKWTISFNSLGGSSQIYCRLFYCGLKTNQLWGATLLPTLNFTPY